MHIQANGHSGHTHSCPFIAIMFGPRANCRELAGVRQRTVPRGFMNREMGGNRPCKGQGAGRSLGHEQFAAAPA